jgi:hypothetical protein
MGVLANFDDSQKTFTVAGVLDEPYSGLLNRRLSGEVGQSSGTRSAIVHNTEEKSIRLLSTTQSSGMARHLCHII